MGCQKGNFFSHLGHILSLLVTAKNTLIWIPIN